MTIDSFSIDIVIEMTSIKSSISKKAIHFGIPSTGGLLKTIKRFLKATNKLGRLFHVDFFMQVSMQEGGFDIHLMEFPFIGCNKGKNKVNGVHFGNRGKGFSIVNAQLVKNL